jgi:hypothetical protein
VNDHLRYRKNVGVTAIRKDHTFVWIKTEDDEIYGQIEDIHENILPGTSGFWRTNDLNLAFRLASERLEQDLKEQEEEDGVSSRS